MLKFIKHHMETIDGIELYPVVSLLVFVLFFTIMLFLVFRTKREHIEEMRQMPLDINPNEDQTLFEQRF